MYQPIYDYSSENEKDIQQFLEWIEFLESINRTTEFIDVNEESSEDEEGTGIQEENFASAASGRLKKEQINGDSEAGSNERVS